MKRGALAWLAATAVALAGSPAATAAQPVPSAVTNDPASDPAHLPKMIVSGLPTGGIKIPVMFYTAADSGRHPTIILLTGMPGAEMNSDLAYAIRRGGWNVVLFHYRGGWGSGGEFSVRNAMEDAAAAVAWLRNPSADVAPFIDPDRIVVAGHSFGGWLAGWTAAHDPKLMGAALISAADLELPADVSRGDVVNYFDGWVHIAGVPILNAKAEALADEVMHDGPAWNLTKLSDNLAPHPLLVITANDGLAPTDDAIAAAVAANAGSRVTKVHFETNHGYNDKRIALAGALVSWLQAIAPSSP